MHHGVTFFGPPLLRGLKPVLASFPRRALALVLLLTFLAAFTRCSSEAAEPPDTIIRSGFISRMFSEVDRGDAKAAIKVWGDIVSKDLGDGYLNETTVFENSAQAINFINKDHGDLVILSSLQFLEIQETVDMEPIGVGVMSDQFLIPEVLLARSDSGISGIADLKGKRLLIDNFGGRGTGQRWLDIELKKAGLPPCKDYCQQVKESFDPGKSVMPVFFKQADACLVRATSFAVMSELNPQLGKNLKLIGSSAPFISGVVAFSRSITPQKRASLMKAIFRLHTHPKGQQILMLFKTDRVEPYKAGMLDSMQKLIDEYEKQYPGKPLESPSSTGTGPIKL